MPLEACRTGQPNPSFTQKKQYGMTGNHGGHWRLHNTEGVSFPCLGHPPLREPPGPQKHELQEN